MNKKIVSLLACMFLFFYTLNYLTPLSFGDDYLYSFVWQCNPMNVPLTEDAVRVSSLKDLFKSQISHYYTWSGRAVSHTIAQLYLWLGKGVFNFFNAFVSVLLIVEIYWFACKGKISLAFSPGMLIGVFFAVWAFSPDFSHVFLWLTGACNYLWTVVFLLGFLLPYVHKFYFSNEKMVNNNWFVFVIFFFGIIAGCSNENTVCWIILLLLVFVFMNRKKGEIEFWMVTGIAGLIVGYLFLMFAPGNMARLLAETKGTHWLTWVEIKENMFLLIIIFFFFHIFLWYFNLRSIYSLSKNNKTSVEVEKELLFAKIMCITSFCMTNMMIFSPTFPPRSAFFGTVLLIIVSCELFRVQEEYGIVIIRKRAQKFVCVVGTIFFVITAATTFYGSYYVHVQNLELISLIKFSDYAKSNVIEVNSLHPVNDTVRKASWFHIMTTGMSDNEQDWRNVAFSRYYGIKGIRMVERDTGLNE